jgi:hypothetical protein
MDAKEDIWHLNEWLQELQDHPFECPVCDKFQQLRWEINELNDEGKQWEYFWLQPTIYKQYVSIYNFYIIIFMHFNGINLPSVEFHNNKFLYQRSYK